MEFDALPLCQCLCPMYIRAAPERRQLPLVVEIDGIWGLQRMTAKRTEIPAGFPVHDLLAIDQIPTMQAVRDSVDVYVKVIDNRAQIQ